MRTYQDPGPLRGHGKAIPKPKQPTTHTWRRRLGTPICFGPERRGIDGALKFGGDPREIVRAGGMTAEHPEYVHDGDRILRKGRHER